MEKVITEIENLLIKIRQIQCNKPYHLNVIEELHINENGHSRILCKLLQYRSQSGEYEFLDSFLNYINVVGKKEFPLKSVSPIITQEEERIDLWIRDFEGKYAIIVENKACGAGDQDTQLYRYVEKTIKKGFAEDNIYIIYLPPTGQGEPSDNSWNGLKEKFTNANQYIKLSFQIDIIKWLEDYILPNIRQKDHLLLTAITQYIDYLKIYFNLNIDKNMEETNALFDNFFGLSQESELKAKQLDAKIEEYQKLLNNLYAYRQQLEEEFTENGIQIIKQKLSEYKDNPKLELIDHDFGGVQFSFEEEYYILFFGKDGNGWYAQIEKSPNTPDDKKELPLTIWQKVRSSGDFPRSSYNRCAWNYYSTVEAAIGGFDKVLKKFI